MYMVRVNFQVIVLEMLKLVVVKLEGIDLKIANMDDI